MIFAIYRGVTKGTDTGEGKFTKGHLYLANPEVDDSVVVDMDKLRVKDDQGEKVWIEPENGRFEYPEEVYAVILKQLGIKMQGEVVVINEADEEGEFLSVVGQGFIRRANLQLLDSAIVKPGMMVYDRSQMRWDRIRRVDECMRLGTEECEEMRECTNFVFAVSDEELSTVPLLRCLDDTNKDNIKKGSIYRIAGMDDLGLLLVIDDNGEESIFEHQRFEFV